MPKIQAETANGLIETEAPAGKSSFSRSKMQALTFFTAVVETHAVQLVRVEILDGDPEEMGEVERDRLAVESELAPNVRLSCQIHVAQDLKVRVINQASVRGMDAGPRPLD
jgi:Na+-transporting NADH:ubiquinone oxidoreductase subunit NqrF